eukprot:scaffold4717_cov53-Attheya_sp.AAC.8
MTTLLPPLPSLTGRVEHRLQLDRTSNGSTDRSRDSEACGTGKSNGRKRPRSPSTNTSSSNHTSTSCNVNNNAGFYLIVRDGALGYTEYLLVVPQALLKLACDAARFGHKVRTSSYHSIDIVIPHQQQSREDSARHMAPVKILELEQLDIDSSPQLDDHNNAGVLSLAEFFELERNNLQGHNNKQAIKRPHHDRIYTIQAKVDSLSPIIAAVPSDPFAMMELYDDSNDSFCCWNAVAILKGACPLQCHPGIQPGDSIILVGVKRQRWHVPQSFAKHKDVSPRLQHRAPTHVFVVTSCNSIQWDRDYHITDTEPELLTQCDLPNRSQESSLPYPVPPLPSTPVPLASIQGTILSTHLTNPGSRNSDACMHKIILRADTSPTMPNTLLAIYLTYYPMSPSLLLGLRGGAIIRAVNVHVVPTWNTETADKAFGACLRSTITILKASSDYTAVKSSICGESSREEGHLHFKQDSKQSPARSICSPRPSTQCSSSRRTQSILSNKESTRDELVASPPRALFPPASGSTTGVDVIHTLHHQTPFSFVSIKRTYDEYAFRAHLYRSWFTESGFKSNRSIVLPPRSDSQVPKFDEIVEALLKFHANQNAKSKLSSKGLEEKYKQNIQESSQSKKTSRSKRRDPYGEFFDHACDECDSNGLGKLIRD